MKTNNLKIAFLVLALSAFSFGMFLFLQQEELIETEACDCEKPIEEIPFFNIP